MGKAEIALYEQFLLFPQCFQKTYFPGASKGVIVWKWVKSDEIGRKFSRRVVNIVGKGEIAHNEQFLLPPQCFQKTFIQIKTRACFGNDYFGTENVNSLPPSKVFPSVPADQF